MNTADFRAIPWALAAAVTLVAALAGPGAEAQVPSSTARPASPREAAPIDLSGQWVAIVNEDWRWRMLTPRKGDYASVPLNEAGRKVADTWTPDADGSCKAYGAGGLMRMPLRVRISWEKDDVLKLETDGGRQVRHFYFSATAPAGGQTLQGRSIATWERSLAPGDGWGFEPGGPPPGGGSLKVVTRDLQPAWLRRNGVPYSENAQVTEYYDRFSSPDGTEWFVVTTLVDDPQYLRKPFITSSHFRREPNPSAWNPSSCKG